MDDGVSNSDYLEQLTYLIFLKMADEYSKPPYKRDLGIPDDCTWDSLSSLSGAELADKYKYILATAIGIEAASQRISTYFINFAKLMEKFKQAAKENRVEQVVKHYLKYTVLIIDEIGYLPVDKAAAYGFFQLIAARYEFRPTILTTNQTFSKWADVFGDAVIANAIIDRLVHHCEIIKIAGHSYRVKDRKIFEDEPENVPQILSY